MDSEQLHGDALAMPWPGATCSQQRGLARRQIGSPPARARCAHVDLLAFVAPLALLAVCLLAPAATALGQAPSPAEVRLPRGLPPPGPLSTWGYDGPADEPAPILLGGDGQVQVAIGGADASAIRLRRLGTPSAPCEVDLRLLRDGDECDLGCIHLRRIRDSDVLVCEREDQDGLTLRTVAAVAEGALWLWCEATEAHAQLSEPLLLLPSVTAGPLALECATIASAPGSGTWALRIGPPRTEGRDDLAIEVPRMLKIAADRLRQHRTLQLECSAQEVCDFALDAFAQVLACCDQDGITCGADGAPALTAARTGPLLCFLRFGHRAAARAQLAPAPRLPREGDDLEGCCWSVIHHGWYLRATLDPAPIHTNAAHLADAAARIEAWLQDALPFARELLAVQALATMGALQDTLDRLERPAAWRHGPPPQRPGSAWSTRSLQALARLEARHWCADAEHFGPAHLRADALLPCATGYLLATGNRAERNARTLLRVLGRDGDRCLDELWTSATSPTTQIYTVQALSQFGARERSAALQRLLAMAGPCTSFERHGHIDGDSTGRAVDAVLYALTGHRLAIGPGIDEDWLRLSPCLPTPAGSIAIRGLTQDGCRADLWLDGGTGTPPPYDATQDPFVASAIDPGQSWTRLTVQLHTAPAPERLVVAACQGQQLQVVLRLGEAFTHVMPDVVAPAWLGTQDGQDGRVPVPSTRLRVDDDNQPHKGVGAGIR